MQNVLVAVSDMERARLFYEGLIETRVKFADGDQWTQYDIGGQNFALASLKEAYGAMSGAAAVFEVDQIDPIRTLVPSLGGRLLEERDMGQHGVSLVVSDPDGNVLYLWARS
jgi:predicted enzyme related to lactoylglutathione lyase